MIIIKLDLDLIIKIAFTCGVSLLIFVVELFAKRIKVKKKYKKDQKRLLELRLYGSELSLCGFSIGAATFGLCLDKTLKGDLAGTLFVKETMFCVLTTVAAFIIYLILCGKMYDWGDDEWGDLKIRIFNFVGSIGILLPLGNFFNSFGSKF